MTIVRGLLVVLLGYLYLPQQTEAVYAENVPTFTLTLTSNDSIIGPRNGYLQSLGEDVRSFAGSYVEDNFKKIDEHYEYSHLSLRAKELSSSASELSICFEGMLFFDSSNVPEYYDIKRLILNAFSQFDSKQILLDMVNISTDPFFMDVSDVLFSFGEVSLVQQSNERSESVVAAVKQANMVDVWLSSTNQWVTIMAGGSIGILSALFLSVCYCLLSGRRQRDDNGIGAEKRDDNDSTLKTSIQNTDSRSFTIPEKSDSEMDNKDEVSEFQYSLKSLESGELSVFTYGQAYAPTPVNKEMVDCDGARDDKEEFPSPIDEAHGILANMEVSFTHDFESPRSQITQPSVCRDFTRSPTPPPQPNAYTGQIYHVRYPTPPPQTNSYNHTTKSTIMLPPSNTLSTEPTPLKSNRTGQSSTTTDHYKETEYQRSDTLLHSYSVKSVIEEESNEYSLTSNSSNTPKSPSSRSVLEGILGESEFI